MDYSSENSEPTNNQTRQQPLATCPSKKKKKNNTHFGFSEDDIEQKSKM